MAEMEKEYTTFSGIPIKELYTPEDVEDIVFERDIGTPGEPPFTRGVYRNMYRGRNPTIRRFTGVETPEDTNKLFRRELELGDKGVGPFEILEIRFIVESEACALAAARINRDQIAALKQAINDMEEEEKRPDASEQADRKFHQIIAEATQNSAIEGIVNWLWELRNQSELSSAFMERLRSEGVHPSIEDHRKIVLALEQRNPEKARAAMRSHIDNATAAAATYFGKAAE